MWKSVNPSLAARCIAESGGAKPATVTIENVQQTLVACATSLAAPLLERVAAGKALNYVGDPRPGVGLWADGLPDIVWCDVAAGEFIMGSTKQADGMARDDEMPQHCLFLAAFFIARYPITNAQFQTFIDDGGYTDKWRKCWTEAGWAWRSDRLLWEGGITPGIYVSRSLLKEKGLDWPDPDIKRLVRQYDPQTKIVVAILTGLDQDYYRVGVPGRTPAAAFAAVGAQLGEMVLRPGELERWTKGKNRAKRRRTPYGSLHVQLLSTLQNGAQTC